MMVVTGQASLVDRTPLAASCTGFAEAGALRPPGHWLRCVLPRLVRVLHAEAEGDSAEGDSAAGKWVWTAGVMLVLFFFFRPVLTPWSR